MFTAYQPAIAHAGTSIRPANYSMQNPVDRAIASVENARNADSNYRDLSEMLSVNKYNDPTMSGLNEYDYPSLSDDRNGLSSLQEISQVKRIPLPAELVERFAYMQSNCMMGLFPAVHRAWLSIDSDIFIWNYEDGTDVAYFDGLSEAILSVALVKPKPGIFQPHIAYLLVLTTPIDIVLLGVSFLQTAQTVGQVESVEYSEMHLLPEPLFSIPTDNVQMLSINSTSSGRVFLAGKDGCLYEIAYQADDGWFSRKCRKINHSQGKLSFIVPSFLSFTFADDDPLVQICIDESRNILFTRSEKGTIQVYDLGEDGHVIKRIAAVSWSTTVQNAIAIARTTERSVFQRLVHIAPITNSESSNINLVGITHSGVRLYFTTYPFGQPSSSVFGGEPLMPCYSPVRPSLLSLIHVRLSPGFTVHGPQYRPVDVHSAFYSKGVLLLLDTQTEDSDVLWTVSSDSFPFQAQLSESYERKVLDGRSWSLAEIPCSVPETLFESELIGSMKRPDPPLVVTQHLQIERKFVIVNSKGTYIITKSNPVDQLHQLLINYGPDAAEVKCFFKLHKEQASAMCLVLMCSRSMLHQEVGDLATRAFFLYSGEPESSCGTGSSPHAQSILGGPTMSTPYQGVTPRQLSFQSPGAAQIPLNSMPPSGQEFTFSNKHRGLCLYVARILRPIWTCRLVYDVTSKKSSGPQAYLTCPFDASMLMWIFQKLHNLKDFVDMNSIFAPSSLQESFSAHLGAAPRTPLQPSRMADVHMDEQTRRRYRMEAECEENDSLKQLQTLISIMCEYLGLWKILCDHQFHTIASGLTKDQQNTLRSMTFHHLVVSGHDICQALIKRLVDMYIENDAAIDTICARLRDVCPTLYSCGDEVYSKANKELNAARHTVNCLDRDHLIASALENYKSVAAQIDLPSVCSQMASVRCYHGIVDLVLSAAPKYDPQNLALHFYNNGKPQSDVQGLQAYNARKECYKCLTETLDYLLSTGQHHPMAPNVPLSPGPPPPNDVGRLSGAEAEKYAEQVYSASLKSSDEMFHIVLYDWLLCKNMSDKLLSIQSPYIESYLQKGILTQPDNLAMLDLMWKYYEKQRNFGSAARILEMLAEKHSPDISLQQRLEYLSRAAMCSMSVTSHITTQGDGDFLDQLEDKLAVARLQMQILDALKVNDYNPEVKDAIAQLNFQLFNISDLYAEFSDKFKLSDCSLAIIHCGNYNDGPLVEALWLEIVDKELQRRTDKASILAAVRDKIVTLGRKYAAVEHYFPIEYLVKYLEQCNVKLDLLRIDPSFVLHIMTDIGITLPRLLGIYDQLFRRRDQCWTALGRPYHLLFTIRQMLAEFTDKPTIVASYERPAFTVHCQDLVAQYLVQLHADSAADNDIRKLVADLKDIQSRLKRTLENNR